MHARSKVDETKKATKKWVRYTEGAERYSMGVTKFMELAKEAKAVYKVDKIVLVNCDIFDKFLETFREFQIRWKDSGANQIIVIYESFEKEED